MVDRDQRGHRHAAGPTVDLGAAEWPPRRDATWRNGHHTTSEPRWYGQPYSATSTRTTTAYAGPQHAEPRPYAPAGPHAAAAGPHAAVGDDDPRWSRYQGAPVPEPAVRPAWGRRRLDASRWHWLLFIPVVVPLIVPLYNRIEPTLGGVPFYYWGQLAFAFLASAVVTVVHLATKGR